MTSIIRIYLYCTVKIEHVFKQEHEMAETCCFSFYVDSHALNDIADQNKNQKQTKKPTSLHLFIFVCL